MLPIVITALILILLVTNLATGFLWLKTRFEAKGVSLPPSSDLRRGDGPSALVVQFDAGSGFGDRVGYYLGFCALAKCWDMEVYAQWVQPEEHDLGHTPLELVQFPENLHFDETAPYREMEYWVTLPNCRDLRFNLHGWGAGFDLVPDLQYAMWCSWSPNFKKEISREDYLKAWREVALEVQPKFDIQAPDTPFLALHLRRGDKTHPNLPDVDAETRRLVEKCLATHRTWAILSDCEDTARSYREFIESHGGTVLAVPTDPAKTKGMLIEFFWITHAAGIVQSVGEEGRSGGFSSFSYLPALMTGAPLIACIPREKIGDTRYQNYARVNKARLKDIFYNNEVDAFLARIPWDGPPSTSPAAA